MAVHRRRPLPRYPISGTRLRRRMLILCALLALASLAPMATAHAQEGGAGALSGGASAFSAGKYEAAVRQLTAALGSDKISASDAAKALYFRGLAYQRLGQSPRAIADLGAAIWLGLSPSERLSAMVNRSLAYRAAGLKTEADAELASARKATRTARWIGFSPTMAARPPMPQRSPPSRPRCVRKADAQQSRASATTRPPPARTADAHDPSSWTTTSPAIHPPSGNRLSRWWGSIRGTSDEAAPSTCK